MMITNHLPRLAFHLLILTGLLASTALGADPFRVDSKPPTSGVITRSQESVEHEFARSEMLSNLCGLLGELTARDFVALRRGLQGPLSVYDSTPPFAYVRMSRKESEDVIVGFTLHTNGKASVHVLDEDPEFIEIDPLALPSSISIQPPKAHTALSDAENNRRFELEHPYSPSQITLDTKTCRSRIRANYPKLTRVLDKETMQVRLPTLYDPNEPAGILIWISPGQDGRVPRIFQQACDDLGLICVGVDSNGNTRPLTDRLQIHLDSIDTLAASYKIDRKRVYLTGMSGGGRCSSILQCSFPEVFAGAVPIVGMDSYHNAPTGKGKEYWPAKLGKPPTRWFKLLKERRIAGITGTVDFNEPEMTIRKNLMLRDKLQIRLDVIEGMGHTMPTSEQFSDALNWVDEPRREAKMNELARAHEMLESFKEKHPQPDPNDPKQLKLLVEITLASPWSDPAWEAAELLGFQRP